MHMRGYQREWKKREKRGDLSIPNSVTNDTSGLGQTQRLSFIKGIVTGSCTVSQSSQEEVRWKIQAPLTCEKAQCVCRNVLFLHWDILPHLTSHMPSCDGTHWGLVMLSRVDVMARQTRSFSSEPQLRDSPSQNQYITNIKILVVRLIPIPSQPIQFLGALKDSAQLPTHPWSWADMSSYHYFHIYLLYDSRRIIKLSEH